jgi:hypothetical protein
MDLDLRLQVAEDGADAERLYALAGYLRHELLQLDVDDVTMLREGEPPPGSRALDVVAVSGLLVALGSSVNGLRAVVSAINNWLKRGDGTHRAVRLEIAGDVLELSDASAADQDRMVALFLSRHAAVDGEQWTASARP